MSRLFDKRGETCLDDDEAVATGLWLVKTLLLHAHPATRYSDPIVHRHALRWKPDECPPADFYKWLVTSTSPPPGLSLWIFRTDEADRDPGGPEFRVPLPTVTADGQRLKFVCFQVSFHGLNVTLVVHPGWRIEHPLEAQGRAVRLWPCAAGVDLATLPIISHRSVSWSRCRVELADGVLGSDELPPLTHSPMMFAAPTAASRYIRSWGA